MADGAPVAAVDCGTNSTRLLIVDGSGRAVAREMQITRLGEGVDQSRRLSPAAISRTLSVLREYRSLMDRHGVGRVRIVATSAARDAENAEEFMAGARDVIGQRPEILSGTEEGSISFHGATRSLPVNLRGRGPVLVTDIGGGSTELSIGSLGLSDASTRRVETRSLDFGCVRVTERYLQHDPPLPSELASATRSVTEEMARARDELPSTEPDGLLLGLAGTVSTLSSLVHHLSVYSRSEVHHSVISREDVEEWLEVLGKENAKVRLRHEGMARGREDVIVGGVLVLHAVMVVFEKQLCVVSEDDILDGLAAGLLD